MTDRRSSLCLQCLASCTEVLIKTVQTPPQAVPWHKLYHVCIAAGPPKGIAKLLTVSESGRMRSPPLVEKFRRAKENMLQNWQSQPTNGKLTSLERMFHEVCPTLLSPFWSLMCLGMQSAHDCEFTADEHSVTLTAFCAAVLYFCNGQATESVKPHSAGAQPSL